MENTIEKTYFISFEGIDGSGKDTQLHKLIETIKADDNYPFGNKYSNIWVTREPTKITPSGIMISNLIRERDVTKEEATKYYIEDRKEHTKLIKEMLKYSHVLISRYDLSTLSYQMTQGMDLEELYNKHNFKDGECIFPDITIVFDLPADIALSRTNSRESQFECFEKIEFQKALESNLHKAISFLKGKGRKVIIVNANQPIEDVTKEMVEKIAQIISR